LPSLARDSFTPKSAKGYFMKTDIAFYLILGVVMAITYLGMQP